MIRKTMTKKEAFECSGNETVHIPVKFEDGVNAVYFFFTGTGKCDMTEFTFIRG